MGRPLSSTHAVIASVSGINRFELMPSPIHRLPSCLDCKREEQKFKNFIQASRMELLKTPRIKLSQVLKDQRFYKLHYNSLTSSLFTHLKNKADGISRFIERPRRVIFASEAVARGCAGAGGLVLPALTTAPLWRFWVWVF